MANWRNNVEAEPNWLEADNPRQDQDDPAREAKPLAAIGGTILFFAASLFIIWLMPQLLQTLHLG